MQVGDRLDSELVLMKFYGTSRDTIRQALEILELDGYVQRMRGKGTFITKSEDKRFNEEVHKYIAVLVPDLTVYIFADIVKSIESLARKEDYDVLAYSTHGNVDEEHKVIKYLIQKGVRGVIVSPVLTSRVVNHFSSLKKHNIPLVMVDQIVSGFNTDYVATNNVSGSYKAVDYLISKGCRTIGLIAGPQIALSGRERFDGYKQALADNGIPLDMQLVEFTNFSLKSGYRATTKLLDRCRVDALFTTNSLVTIGAMQAISDKGLRVPDDLDVAAFDAIEYSFYTLLTPSAMVAQPSGDLGTMAWEVLQRRMQEGTSPSQYEKIILEPRLVVKGIHTVKPDALRLSAAF